MGTREDLHETALPLGGATEEITTVSNGVTRTGVLIANAWAAANNIGMMINFFTLPPVNNLHLNLVDYNTKHFGVGAINTDLLADFKKGGELLFGEFGSCLVDRLFGYPFFWLQFFIHCILLLR
jgi:hypothetical protein